MGFKNDVRAKAIELDERVTALENLARQLRVPNAVAGLPVRPANTVERDVTGTAVRRTNATFAEDRDVVDYGAIAFGLSTLKADVNGIRNSGSDTTTDQVNDYYRGAVQYFADVFAKADPSFDVESFKRQAGV